MKKWRHDVKKEIAEEYGGDVQYAPHISMSEAGRIFGVGYNIFLKMWRTWKTTSGTFFPNGKSN